MGIPSVGEGDAKSKWGVGGGGVCLDGWAAVLLLVGRSLTLLTLSAHQLTLTGGWCWCGSHVQAG